MAVRRRRRTLLVSLPGSQLKAFRANFSDKRDGNYCPVENRELLGVRILCKNRLCCSILRRTSFPRRPK